MRIILWRPGFHFVSSLNAAQQQTPGEEPTERGKDTLKLPEEWGKIQQWLPKCRSNCSTLLLHKCHVTLRAFSIYINPSKHWDPNVPLPITRSTVWFSPVWGITSQPHPCPSKLGGQNEQVTSHLPSIWHFSVNFATLHLLSLQLKATTTGSFPVWDHHENWTGLTITQKLECKSRSHCFQSDKEKAELTAIAQQ